VPLAGLMGALVSEEEYATSFTKAPSNSPHVWISSCLAMKVSTSSGRTQAFDLGFLVEDSHLSFEIRAGLEWSRAIKPPLEASSAGRSSRPGMSFGRRNRSRSQSVFWLFVQLVEGVEKCGKKLFLRSLFIAEELNVIDEQHIRGNG